MADCVQWSSLPVLVLNKIAQCLIDDGHSPAAMRETCRSWRTGAASLDAVLTPLGRPDHYRSFSGSIASIDVGSRGAGVSHDDEQVATLAAAAPRATFVSLAGAWRVKDFTPIEAMGRTLRGLVLDDTTIVDGILTSTLPCLSNLTLLSLRRCAFLTGSFLTTADLPPLRHLNLSNCAMSLALAPAVASALTSLSSLTSLALAGAGPDDATLAILSSLAHIHELDLSKAQFITEFGLEALGRGAAGTAMTSLDVSGCTALRDGLWDAIARGFPQLRRLSLDRVLPVLHPAVINDAAAAAAWRWPHLTRLSLAGARIHPTKLKLLTAACGPELVELDVSARSGSASSLALCVGRPPFARLPGRLAQDLVDSCRSMRNLTVLRASGSGLPLDAAVAALRANPRLAALDLSGCDLAPGKLTGRLWTSGGPAYAPGALPVGGREAAAAAAAAHAAPGPREFGIALGRLQGLTELRLNDCGLSADHLEHLRGLTGLKTVGLGGNARAGAGAAAVAGLVGCMATLEELDVSGMGIGDEDVAVLCGGRGGGAGARQAPQCSRKQTPQSPDIPRFRQLRVLSLARNGRGITSSSLRSVAAAGGATTLAVLDVSDCGLGSVVDIAALFPNVRTLRLAGCGGAIKNAPDVHAAVQSLRLYDLDISRCGDGVDDALMSSLASSQWQLTRLRLDGAQRVTPAGLEAVLSLHTLAELDLTCVTGLADDDAEVVRKYIPRGHPATIFLPQGAVAGFLRIGAVGGGEPAAENE